MRKKLQNFTIALLSCVSLSVFGQTDITDLGGTISAQHSDSRANETVSMLTDNSSATKYLTPNSSGWVQFQATQPYLVTKYSITSANDAPEGDPKSWTLQGSTNGSTWYNINNKNNQVFATRALRREFSFPNSNAYKYYRLNMTSNGGTMLQLAELELFGVPTTTVIKDITNLPGEVTTQYSGSPATEGIDKLVDNNASTKFLTFHNAAWVKLQQGNASVVTKYTLTSANDAETRDPLNWTLEGSKDNLAWTLLDTRNNEDFPTRHLKREFTFSNTNSYSYYRLNMTNNSGDILQLGEWEMFGIGGGGVIPIPTPPATWQEHWFDHNQLVSLVYQDNDVAVYYDNEVDRSVTWTYKFFGDVWRYTKSVYGYFGKDPRLYTILHTGKHGGGHPGGYLSAGHDYRNVIDVGAGPWTTFDYNAVAVPTHEVAHIVEGSSKGTDGSPAFGLWGDSKWAEIYNYDVYRGIGRNDFAEQWYNEQIGRSDNFPRANTFWFRDWFYPIYSQYGEAQVLNRYFTLLSQCFPKNGIYYARALNWGEFVHFWSGAAGVNLKSMATNAFGWPAEYEAQFRKAQSDFSCFTYSNASARVALPEESKLATEDDSNELSVWYNQNAKVITVGNETAPSLEGTIEVYSLVGKNMIKRDVKSTINVATIDVNTLAPGVYVVKVNAGNKKATRRIVVQ